MPSPLAHSALVGLALPAAVGRQRFALVPLAHRIALGAILCLVLVLPDFDFVFSLLGFSGSDGTHGSWSHSVIWVIPAGLGFAIGLPAAGSPMYYGSTIFVGVTITL